MTKFSIFTLPIDRENGNIVYKSFIVLRNGDLIRFTNYHKWAHSAVSNVHRITADNGAFCRYITTFLNYLFFEHKNKDGSIGIGSLNNVTIDQIQLFLNKYAMGMLAKDDRKRGTAAITKMIDCVLSFMTNYIEDKTNTSSLCLEDLVKTVNVRDHKTGKTRKKLVPVFNVEMDPDDSEPQLRDMPNAVFDIIFSHIYVHHKELLGLVALGAFAGLRPGDAINVRREDSVLGPGIFFSYRNNRVTKIRIDLKEKKRLRDGHSKEAGIKKKGDRFVPPFFLDVFKQYYDAYLEYISDIKYDERYGPLCINRQGKAYTADSYRRQFQKIIKEEIIPILIHSEDPELVDYGNQLRTHKINPHIFRHYFTVQLVLNGVSNPGDIAFYRGDKSLESATTYLSRKTEFQKMYKRVSNDAFDTLSDIAERTFK